MRMPEFWSKLTKTQLAKLGKNHQICTGVRAAVRYDKNALLVRRGGGMLLHCESVSGAADDGAALAASWLRAGALDSLIELNELCLSLLAEQAAVRSGPPSGLLQQLGELWQRLDAAARQRAAACPYLLLDAGFADPLRSQSAAARVLLGMPASSAALIGHYTLRQIQTLAETHLEWLRPRWPARVQVWRELLLAAVSGEVAALERARLWGLTLLAAEVRFAPAAWPPRAALAAAPARHLTIAPSP